MFVKLLEDIVVEDIFDWFIDGITCIICVELAFEGALKE